MQLQAFGHCVDVAAAIEALEITGTRGALYEDVNDPTGIAVVTYTEDEEDLAGPIRKLYQGEPFIRLEHKPELTMIGRTYSIGYEPDLSETLIERPKRTLVNEDWPWAIWYPLRRRGGFAHLDREEQMAILKEHGTIGMRFGRGDYAHDIRLACHGLDAADNDFLIGLTGKALWPLSKLVETMRQTIQTSMWLEKLGPFFVGHKVWQKG